MMLSSQIRYSTSVDSVEVFSGQALKILFRQNFSFSIRHGHRVNDYQILLRSTYILARSGRGQSDSRVIHSGTR